MKHFLLSILVAFACFGLQAQKKVALKVTPSDATINVKNSDGTLKQIGVGSAEVEVERNSTTAVVVKREGFRNFEKVYKHLNGEKPPKEDLIELKERQVTLNIQPYDAKVYLDGREVSKGSLDIWIPLGSSGTVEVKKLGYLTKTKTYHNKEGFDLPPISEKIELKERTVQIISNTSGAEIFADDKKIGDNNAEIIINENACVVARISKEGFAPIEKTYCNKEGVSAPPTSDKFTLQDRLILVNTTPETAIIFVDGKEVAKGEFKVKVLKGVCVEVIAKAPGFVEERKNYCNQDNMAAPPFADNLKLTIDEAFTSSVASDQANVNFTIEVNAKKSEDEAWKVMSQIVTSAFDILEIADKETGYIRTAWSVKYFKNNTIRSRVIVKLGDSNPLKYVVKIVSEESGKSSTSIKDDDQFKSWDRILNTYKDFINEMQSRLK